MSVAPAALPLLAALLAVAATFIAALGGTRHRFALPAAIALAATSAAMLVLYAVSGCMP